MYKQALADVGTEWFEEAENAFRQTRILQSVRLKQWKLSSKMPKEAIW